MSSWEANHLLHLKSTPSPDGLRAMARATGRGTTVGRVRRLGGGLGCATSAVELIGRSGARRMVVLKRFPAGEDARPEWERLTFALAVDVPSPEPVALDQAGEWFGSPALVMSKMPGAPLLRPARRDQWLREVAEALTRIQAFDVARAPEVARPKRARRAWKRPDTSGWGAVYERAADAVERMLPHRSRARSLCHGDFHPGNMLFSRERLSGLVDWNNTRIGPRSFELSYCRTEVALLFGGDAPEELREAYASASGRSPPDTPLWDLMCALSARRWSHMWLGAYHEQGARDLTLRHFRSRLNAFTARALSEV